MTEDPAPRLAPVDIETLDEKTRALLERTAIDGRVFNLFSTLAHHPDLLSSWLVFATHVLSRSTLAPRHREILILRIGWLCASEYEWGQHVLIGRREGLTEEEFAGIAKGPEATIWNPVDRLLLLATDELHQNARIQDTTWAELETHFDRQQLIDIVFVVGEYNMVSMVLNTLGVQRDEGVPGFHETVGRSPQMP